jgi:hypothetical protein
MPSSVMLRHVALVRTDVSEKRSELVTANIVPSSPFLVTLMMNALCSSETSVLTRVTLHNIPEDGLLHSHSREVLKSYGKLICFRPHARGGSHVLCWARYKKLSPISDQVAQVSSF